MSPGVSIRWHAGETGNTKQFAGTREHTNVGSEDIVLKVRNFNQFLLNLYFKKYNLIDFSQCYVDGAQNYYRIIFRV